ncbi:MAG: response regulator [Ktedonobacteraceae bacterium]
MQNNKKILIVDDSEDMRTLLGQVLEDEGYTLFFAEDGNMAVSQAVAYQPNIILMDMSLPGITGWEAVEQLRQKPEFQHTPIIAVTAYVTKADEERAKEVGCDAHLGKPFDILEVVDTIDTLLQQEWKRP